MLCKIETNFSKYKNADLLALGQNVVFQITSNVSLFNDDVISQKDKLKPMCEIFKNHIDAANTRATLEIKKRNDYRLLFIRKLKIISTILNLDYRGNETVLDASGFKLIIHNRNLLLTPITDVLLTQSNQKGYIDIKMQGGNNYKSINVLYSVDETLDEKLWQSKMVTTKKTSIGQYSSSTNIHVKLVAYGKDSSSEESMIKSISVQ